MSPKAILRNMSEEDKEIRDVYANFGLAIYAAQCLEHGLVNALLYIKLVPSRAAQVDLPQWAAEVDAFTETHFEHTLGKLIKDLNSVTDVPPELLGKLLEALRLRNRLAHDYFRERAKDFLFSEGRTAMILELQQAVKILRGADEELTNVLRPILQKYGITEEKITQMAEEMLSGD